MIRIRKAEQRGHFNHGWLDTKHTFSFAAYYDPENMGFRQLRVINEDRVMPGKGFPTHGHKDMEIISYVLQGGLSHRDSLDNGSTIRPGEIQRMSAGTGVMHSEFNHSANEIVHFLQIWILPEREGLAPEYEQRFFPKEEKQGKLRIVASPDGREGSVTIHQDVDLYCAILPAGAATEHALKPGRHAWVQVARGSLLLSGQAMSAGDGAAISEEKSLVLECRDGEAELLLFDLP